MCPAELVCAGAVCGILFGIPRDVLTICVGKRATYARCGIIVNVTPFELGKWEGLCDAGNLQHHAGAAVARIYANEGLCQILFFQGDEPCETSFTWRPKTGEIPSEAVRESYRRSYRLLSAGRSGCGWP